MKRAFLFILAFCNLPILLVAQIGMYQHGSVVRMHMGDCMLAHHGMTVAFGPPAIPSQDSCPEYTLVSTNVVYVIVGKSSNQLIPLSEVIDFRLHRNELAVRAWTTPSAKPNSRSRKCLFAQTGSASNTISRQK